MFHGSELDVAFIMNLVETASFAHATKNFRDRYQIWILFYLFFFLKNILFIFREGGWRKKGRETSVRERYIDQLPLTCHQPGTWLTNQVYALTRSWTGNLSVPRLVLSPLSHTSQSLDFIIKKSFFISHIRLQVTNSYSLDWFIVFKKNHWTQSWRTCVN